MKNTKISKLAIEIFEKSVNDYHVHDDISSLPVNPYEKKSFEHLLYEKNWTDTVQWHYEDIIRDPEIDPIEGMKLKRMIMEGRFGMKMKRVLVQNLKQKIETVRQRSISTIYLSV